MEVSNGARNRIRMSNAIFFFFLPVQIINLKVRLLRTIFIYIIRCTKVFRQDVTHLFTDHGLLLKKKKSNKIYQLSICQGCFVVKHFHPLQQFLQFREKMGNDIWKSKKFRTSVATDVLLLGSVVTISDNGR